jgi:simple sugar transport system ATP-binding protein
MHIQQLTMTNITKTFPGVLANDQVCLEVNAGEVLALLGENGAGKSTLMKVLYGLYRPDAGEIRINGEPVSIHSPRNAMDLGIGMVHQHFMLVPTLTVVENIVLGLPSSRGFVLDLDRAAERITQLSKQYGLKVDPWAYIWQLSVGEQQRVEILKVLYRGAELLILDEPTAVLTPQEVEELFVTLEGMLKLGHSIIFITHKLKEVMRISKRVTVLRAGRSVHNVFTAETNEKELARMMVGRDLAKELPRKPIPTGEVVLDIQNLHALNDQGLPALEGFSLQIHSGEIVGLAGVSGNGQRELAEVIACLRPVKSGSIRIRGDEISNKLPETAIQAGLGYIPEDRLTVGTIPSFSVRENLIIKDLQHPPLSRHGFLDLKMIQQTSEQLVHDYDVKTPTIETHSEALSGGNIQKLVLAREINRNPAILIAAQPTRGLDIGATEYVHKRLLEQREKGRAVFLISEDLDEIMALSDRIAVIYEGHIMGIIPIKQAQREQIGLLMAGVEHQPAASE